VVVSRAVVRDLFDGKEASRFYAMMMIVGGIGPIVSPFMGSFLITFANWRSIFWVVSGFGLVCVAAAARNIPETLAPDKRLRNPDRRIWRDTTHPGRPAFHRPALALG
jgi:DHA1 family bicyclomycin/chloramphenicol resistance-like MFS transporter